MAHTFASGLQLDVVLDAALRAFKRNLAPLQVFSTRYNDVALNGTDTVQVPYYPLVTAASTDFNGTYSGGADAVQESRPVVINKRKYQPLSFTSAQLRRQPNMDWDQVGTLKGEKLAEDVLNDIMSVITLANYGNAAFTGAASTFDSDDVIDIRTACNQAHWPLTGRGLIMDSDYYGNLLKDGAIKGAMEYGSTQPIREGSIGRLSGFDLYETPLIPANGQNLVGFAAWSSALLVATSPIAPAPEVRSRLTDYRVVTDPDTGLSLEYRSWGEADTDTAMRVLEVNYGYAKGEAAALKRIVSA